MDPLSPNSSQIPINSTDNHNADHNVRIAASALQDMRTSRSPSIKSIPPITTDPPLPTNEAPLSTSRLPAVFNSAMNLYDYSKQNSRIVSYSAGVVESGAQALSNRLPTRILNYVRDLSPGPATPLSARDEQNSMQLDAAERESSVSEPYRKENESQRALSIPRHQEESHRQSSGEIPTENNGKELETADILRGQREPPIHIQMDRLRAPVNDAADDVSMDLSINLNHSDRPPSTAPTDTTRFTARSDTLASPRMRQRDDPSPSTAVSRRSPWQAVMVEAGGISAAVSDEGMRKLKYCLEWLQWATVNLDTQITLLETFIASINASVTGEIIPSSATVSPEALQHYMSVKRNVVSTIRQVVEVVGKYAGGSLPEPAKQKVKGFILSLPGRWSVAVKDAGLGQGWENMSSAPSTSTEPMNGAGGGGGDSATATGVIGARGSSTVNPRKRNRLESSSQSLASEATTGSSSATVTGTISTAASSTDLATPASVAAAPGQPGVKRAQLLPPTAGAARHAAHRVLTLAQESLHAVKGVTGVFKETLERAETWVDRFRRVGYSQGNRYANDSEDGGSLRLYPPPRGYTSSPSSHSPSTSSALSFQERRRMHMSPRDLHLEALARSIPSVGPYGPYGTGNTPPMSPVLAPEGSSSSTTRSGKSFPFDNPAPGYGWSGGRRKSDSGLSAVPTLNLSEKNQSGRSRAGSYSQYEDSTGESLPPPSVGSTSSVAGDDELDEDGEYDQRRVTYQSRSMVKEGYVVPPDEEEGPEHRVRKRRRKEVK